MIIQAHRENSISQTHLVVSIGKNVIILPVKPALCQYREKKKISIEF